MKRQVALATRWLSLCVAGTLCAGCATPNEQQGHSFAQPVPSVTPARPASAQGVVVAGTDATIDLSHEAVGEVLVMQVSPSNPGPSFAVRADAVIGRIGSVSLGSSVVPGGQRDATFLLRVPPEVLKAWKDAQTPRTLRVALVAVDATGALPPSARIAVSFRALE